MRQETKDTTIKLVEALPNGIWAIRWNFHEKSNEPGVNEYQEEYVRYIPTMKDIQQIITTWFNKQTDTHIKYGFTWQGVQVYLNDESKFNFKAITDEAARREAVIKKWDEEHPLLAGQTYIKNGEIGEPTGRPISLFPVTLKLGTSNTPENFKVFETLEELQEFFSAGVDHLISAYGAGWYKIATFDWSVYQPYLDELNQN